MSGGVPTIADVQAAVCAHFNMTRDQLISERQDQLTARPRMVGMYLARELACRSFTTIGMHFGGRDHSTVIRAINAVPGFIANDPSIAAAVGYLRARLAPADSEAA